MSRIALGSQETRDRVSDNVYSSQAKRLRSRSNTNLVAKKIGESRSRFGRRDCITLLALAEQPSIRACVCTIPNGSPASLDTEPRNRPRSVGLSSSRLAVSQVFKVYDDLRSCTDTHNILPRHSKYYDERVHLSLLIQRPIDTEPA